MAYAQLEPFGNDQMLFDMQLGSLQAMTANIHKDPKKGKRYKPDDFMLLSSEKKEPMTETDIYQGIKAALGMAGKHG